MRCILLAVLCFVATSATAQELWNGAEVAMGVDTLAVLFPDAEVPAKPSTLGNGAAEGLRLGGLEIAGRAFSARFYILDGGLSQVTLSLDNPNGDTFVEMDGVYASLQAALESKYGDPTDRDEYTSSMMRSETTHYRSGRVNIMLFRNGVTGRPALLNVVYQTRTAENADKL